MSIRTLLIMSVTLLVAFCLAAGALVYVSEQTTERIAAQASHAETLIGQVFSLEQLAVQYVMYFEERPRQQWQRQAEIISQSIDDPVFDAQPGRSFRSRLRADLEAIVGAFDTLVDRSQIVASNAAVRDQLVGDLMVNTQRIITDTDALAKEAFAARSSARQRSTMLMLFVLGVFATVSFLANIILYIKILRPLSLLQKGTKRIGEGHLEHRIDNRASDEIGELARSFDAMAERLQSSHDQLERRVEERTRDLHAVSQRNGILLQSIGDGVIAIDRGWKITLFNKAAYALSGWSPEEAIGQPFRDVIKFVRNQDRSENVEFIEHAMVTGRAAAMENHTSLVRRDGTDLPVSDSAAPIFDDAGNVTGAIIIFRDATGELEARMLKSDFAYASHQLRTPINKALWGLDSVLAEAKQRGVRQRLSESMRAIRSISKISSELLEISDIDQDRVMVKPGVVAVSDVLAKTKEQADALAKTFGGSLTVGSIPRGARVLADANLLVRCFAELLSNAFQYGNGSDVTLSASRKEGRIIFEIMDSGIGIIEQEQPLIFTKFFRGGNIDTTNVIGAGLGLYIAISYVKLMNGQMWFRSREGKGTTFFLSLPMDA